MMEEPNLLGDYRVCQVGYSRFVVDKRYVDLKPIGDGSYGMVVSAFDSVAKRPVAIKKVRDAFADIIDAKRILREIKLLKHFNHHSNIISIFDVMIYPPNSSNFTDIYIVTNLLESDLERIIVSRQALSDQHYQYFLYQILRGLKYVHSANVLHRDLKPSNILVNSNCDLALCDFGLARGFHAEYDDTMTEYVVTRWYRAPELLCLSTRYGKAVDVWSVGCIFAELITQAPFFRGENPGHQLEQIVSKLGCPPRSKLDFVDSNAALQSILKYEHATCPPFSAFFPGHTNPLALDLCYRMLQFHPDDRISVEEALSHPYLKDFHASMSEANCPSHFDFGFEASFFGRGEEMTGPEVQYHIYQEMRSFRPMSPPYSGVLVDVIRSRTNQAEAKWDPSISSSSSSSSSVEYHQQQHKHGATEKDIYYTDNNYSGEDDEMPMFTPREDVADFKSHK